MGPAGWPYSHQLTHMSAPDATELTALLDRYERPLVRYALSILGDLEHARDAVQETFIRYVRDDSAPRGMGSEKHIEAWLFTVARHRAIDLQRKTSRIIPMPILDNRTSDEPGPAAATESRDTHASLLRLLDHLTPNQREVIRLKFQNDLSYQEIADILELSATNVGFILHTGLKKLREIVRAEPDFADLTSAAS
jgi:RNA polymerase sigma factor (sigma-70 family)